MRKFKKVILIFCTFVVSSSMGYSTTLEEKLQGGVETRQEQSSEQNLEPASTSTSTSTPPISPVPAPASVLRAPSPSIKEDLALEDFVGRWVEDSPERCNQANYQGGFTAKLVNHRLHVTVSDEHGKLIRTQNINSLVQIKLDKETTSLMVSGVDFDEITKKSFTVFYTADYSGSALKINSLVENGILVVSNGIVVEHKDTGDLPLRFKAREMPTNFKCSD